LGSGVVGEQVGADDPGSLAGGSAHFAVFEKHVFKQKFRPKYALKCLFFLKKLYKSPHRVGGSFPTSRSSGSCGIRPQTSAL